MSNRFAVAAVTAMAVLVCLAGCGKAGRPVAPQDSTYPQVYPNPTLGPAAARQLPGRAEPPAWDEDDLKARFTKQGTYRDPAVEANQMGSQGRVPPGANLPNSRSGPSDSPMEGGLGAPNQSPLPPLQPFPAPEGTDGQ